MIPRRGETSWRPALALLLVLLPSALAACGRGAGGSQRISFMVSGDPHELKAYQELVRTFESKQPAVRVELIHIPSQADYRKRLGADFVAGTPADVLLINYRRFAGFAARRALEPLGRYLARSTVIRETDFYPEALAAFRWRGELVGIPQNLSSLVVYYNKNLFDKANLPYPRDDWTWDDFLKAAKALTRDGDGDGKPEQYGLGVEPSLVRLAPFIWQNGGRLVNDEARPRALTLYDDAGIAATEWFVALQVKHHVVPDAAEERAEDSESRFQNGRTAIYLNSRRGVPTYRAITTFDWDVAALPRRKERAGVLHSDAYFMPASAKHKEAAWKFIEFANSPEGQRIVAASGRTVPSLKAVAESPAFLDPGQRPLNSRVFLTTIPFIRALPQHPNWVDVEEIATDELERAFYGRADVHEALIVAEQRTREYFRQ